MDDDRRARPFLERDLDPDPLRQFERWFADARNAGIPLAEAMALATATPDGVPSARMVLLKEVAGSGFVFHTGYGSRKAGELERNPRAALLFHWYELGRQVRIEGEVSPLGEADSDEYFRTRPRGGQVAAWASRQSAPVAGRDELEAAFSRYEAEFEGREVPRPPEWGGFRLRPSAFEFWQHRENRLHDRFRYEQDGAGGWAIQRLAP